MPSPLITNSQSASGRLRAEFWQLPLQELNDAEWEALCDGCGKCCLHKLQDEDTLQVYYTRVACKLLDCETCRCTDYSLRFQKVSGCLNLRSQGLDFTTLPETCAYRLRHESAPLYSWHPLLASDTNRMHSEGLSVRATALSENDVHPDDFEQYLIDLSSS